MMSERKMLREQVAEGIRDYIIENSLKPGDRLPTEHELAERFGVSRISVREATKALGFLGILDAAPRRGLTVASVDMRRVSEYLGFHLALAHYPLKQLVETRIIIECGSLPHLIDRMADDPDVYDRLNHLNGQLRNTTQPQEWMDLDIQFHRTLLRESGLKPLSAFGGLLEIFFRRIREGMKERERINGVEAHQRIIDAARAGTRESACNELRAHVENHLQRIRESGTIG